MWLLQWDDIFHDEPPELLSIRARLDREEDSVEDWGWGSTAWAEGGRKGKALARCVRGHVIYSLVVTLAFWDIGREEHV